MLAAIISWVAQEALERKAAPVVGAVAVVAEVAVSSVDPITTVQAVVVVEPVAAVVAEALAAQAVVVRLRCFWSAMAQEATSLTAT